MIGLLYTHYYGAWLIVAHGIHILLTTRNTDRRRWIVRFGVANLGALLVYAPWLPVIYDQFYAHPAGPLATPVVIDLGTLNQLRAVIMGGAHWRWNWLFALGLLVVGLRTRTETRSAVILIMLWVSVTPLIALLLVEWKPNMYQVRYVLAIVPGGILLITLMLRAVPWKPLMLALVIGLALQQITLYDDLWPEKPQWQQAFTYVIAHRDPQTPAVTLLQASSVEAYYARRLDFWQGTEITLPETVNPDPGQIATLVAPLRTTDTVWAVLPTNTSAGWYALADLAATHTPDYRASVLNLVFYRFARGTPEGTIALQWQFGDLLRLDSPAPGQHFFLHAGETLCITLDFTAIMAVDGLYSAGLHVVDGRQHTVAGWDGGVGAHGAGEAFALAPCFDIAADATPGRYDLRLTVYNWATVERLRVFEGSDSGAVVPWWDEFFLGTVTVIN